ncbi:MAG: BLUF domain-containing protein [Sagittula sp.]|uniref:BLUF domain-containing protein n=1 Tax=Sagittula sp. TaxID=2038081 RepID=UPI00405A327B
MNAMTSIARPGRVATGQRYSGMAVVDFDHITGGASATGPGKEAKGAPLVRAICISHTRTRLSDRILDRLMAETEKHNALRQVSGLLLYKSRNFFEVLEGPQDMLDQTLERIYRDPRHYKMKVMFYGPARMRRFDGWSMGFRRLEGTTTTLPCYFSLTRRELEKRFPRGATKEIMFYLRGYLNLRFPPPPPAEPSLTCRVIRDLSA